MQTGDSVEYMSLSLQALQAAVDGDLVPALGQFAEAAQPSEYAVAQQQQAAAEQSTEIRVEKPTFYKEVKNAWAVHCSHFFFCRCFSSCSFSFGHTHTFCLSCSRSLASFAHIITWFVLISPQLVVHPISIAVTFKNTSTSEFLAAIPLELEDFKLRLSSCALENQTLKATELSTQLTNIYTKKVRRSWRAAQCHWD